jgi:hypothetical protein
MQNKILSFGAFIHGAYTKMKKSIIIAIERENKLNLFKSSLANSGSNFPQKCTIFFVG